MTIRTRFAPSPTGFLHIGSLRTAIFNWLYSRAKGGKFLLRIEDTDLERSTKEFTDGIFESLSWMNIKEDEPWVLQSDNLEKHKQAAKRLVDEGKAYYCYCSKEELEEMRKAATDKKEAFKYNRKCLNNPTPVPGRSPVVRLKANTEGFTEFDDLVQRHIKINNRQMDDMILLRSDGSPTYMLSVVIDDINMGITHVIRGDDHLTNTFRQIQLYQALGANVPCFAHIPLINGPDGTKLSKRHGAVNVMEYAAMGILPEAFFNYMIRLGWAHGNDEIISIEDAIKWFDIVDVGRSAARFDMNKLLNLNGHYIREKSNDALLSLFDGVKEPFLTMLRQGMTGIKERSKTLVELRENAKIYTSLEVELNPDAQVAVKENRDLLAEICDILKEEENWTHDHLESLFRELADTKGVKLGAIAKPIRAALCGKLISPSIFEIMEIIGKEVILKRVANCL